MLGLVSATDRTAMVRRNYTTRYDHLIGQPTGQDIYLTHSGETEQTPAFMAQIVQDTLQQTERLAGELEGKNLYETCRNIWHFIHGQINYKQDSASREELRSPARTWKERLQGVDCDCYSIFASSILTNLRIPHAFRMTKYAGRKYYQHIYVIVPTKTGHITIDAVLDRFDAEKPFSAKKDMPLPVAHLAGIDTEDGLNGNIFKKIGAKAKQFYNWQKKPMNKVGQAILKVDKAVTKIATPIAAFIPGVGPAAAAALATHSKLLDKIGKVKASTAGQAFQALAPLVKTGAQPASTAVKVLPVTPISKIASATVPSVQAMNMSTSVAPVVPILSEPAAVAEEEKILGIPKQTALIGGAAIAALLLLK